MVVRRSATLIVLLVLTAACGGGDDASADRGGSRSDHGGLVSGDDYSVESALAELPVPPGDDLVTITTADLVTASELTGADRPSEPDAAALRSWVATVTGTQGQEGEPGPKLFIALARGLGADQVDDIDEFEAEVGWSLADVDAFVEQSAPPRQLSVVAGRFHDAAPEGDDVEDLSEGIVTAGEGEDLDQVGDAPTAARPLGQPLRMSRRGDRIAASLTTPEIESWRDGEGETWADDEAMAAVAATLDEAEAVSAVLVGRLPSSDTPVAVDGDAAELASHDAVGLGWSVADDRATVTVAYHLGSGADVDAASRAAEEAFAEGTSARTGRPISDLVTVEDVATSGPVVVVTLTPAGESWPDAVYEMLLTRDIPFTHA